ncbi:hypothetical protein FGO68_gene13948 [Halteria grandinella]|uniref:Uncharacterized protein n=1 Tax=Halteria grandinella TaxID=5974 RepID=A0A8J8NUF8_HALGN|nr:hypothetical protein FGO68_gene13948 [Halteria grandinella]
MLLSTSADLTVDASISKIRCSPSSDSCMLYAKSWDSFLLAWIRVFKVSSSMWILLSLMSALVCAASESALEVRADAINII